MPTKQQNSPARKTSHPNMAKPWPKPQRPLLPAPPATQQNFSHIPERLGNTSIQLFNPNSIVTNPTGFIASYDAVINPYNGCSFGCDYCYASNFVPTDVQKETWGSWVKVKTNAAEQLKRLPHGSLNDKVIYISTATDPYQPIEKTAEITLQLLQLLLELHPRVKLVIQTRSPLVTRDINLFKQLITAGGKVQVNMTITTDDDNVRKTYEPGCPSISARTKAIAEVQAHGIQSCITMTPLLPLTDVKTFAENMLATGVTRFIVQAFHLSNRNSRKFIARTDDRAIAATARHFDVESQQAIATYTANYASNLTILKKLLPNLGQGKHGFNPPF